MFLYSRSLERGKEGGFLFLCIREDVLIVRPGFINVGKFRVLGNAGSDGELVSGVIEEVVGGDGRGGEIDILHLGWGGGQMCHFFLYSERVSLACVKFPSGSQEFSEVGYPTHFMR